MSEQNVALFRRVAEELWNGNNPDLIPEIYAEDFVLHTPVGDFTGHDGYRGIYDSYLTAFPDLQFAIADAFGTADKAVMRWTFSGTHSGEFMGVAPTGKQVSVSGMATARIADDRLAEEWAVWDLHGLMQQIGAIT
jgi:steroid delta-isomerase-like uncharacterized protein